MTSNKVDTPNDKMEFDLTYKSTNYRVYYKGEEYYLYQEWDETDGGGSGSIEIVNSDGCRPSDEVYDLILSEYYK